MMKLDAATVLLQWATGGLAFLWVTTRRREVGIGYGWLMRGIYIVMAVGSVFVGTRLDPVPVRDAFASLAIVAATVALGVSIVRRKAGVLHQNEEVERRSARVAAMTGIDREVVTIDRRLAEFPPALDAIAPALGLLGLVAAGIDAGGPAW